ncbi:MAG: family 20 glycosylhydrolase, partial [Muribaculaceae bacterium]|nr:family 20 glycosylhydrolase [Muribaculaceae bacterium]
AEFLAQYLKEMTGKLLAVTDQAQDKNAIVLSDGLDNDNPEAYRLTVTKDLVTIDGASAAGTFYGIQTLRKSIPEVGSFNVDFPAVTVDDQPRFGYRGAHLDVARHFFPVDSIKKFIDMLALHNINRFHWHITDDQGWRLEIKSRPGLTEIGSKRSCTVIGRNTENYDTIPVSGFYTQEEARDIVDYAARQNIVVIPEIDLPGHMVAALAAYPELGCTGGPYEVFPRWGVTDDVLCAGNDSTYKLLTDVLDEVVDIFPSEYIHIGGDECPKVRWEKCPKCQAKIRQLGLKKDARHTAEERLQSYVMTYVENYLADKCRRVIGWDEILEGGLGPNATVMSWRGVEGGAEAVRQGHDAIMTPNTYLYFDYYQTEETEDEPLGIGGFVPVDRVYAFDPILEGMSDEEASHILGVQANLWTEYVKTYPHVEYMMLPRMAALSEVQWTQPDKKDYRRFLGRLRKLLSIYDAKGYNYATHVFDVTPEIKVADGDNGVKVALITADDAPIYYTLDGTEPTEKSLLYTDTITVSDNSSLRAVAIRNGVRSHVCRDEFVANKATGRPITMLEKINPKYTFAGASTLVDGVLGKSSFKSGRWIGFCGNDMVAVVDLGEPQEVSKVSINTLVECGHWIMDLRAMAVAVSADGETFTEVAREEFPSVESAEDDGIHTHALEFPAVTARYVKVTALSERELPAWIGAAGSRGHLFVDEISIF